MTLHDKLMRTARTHLNEVCAQKGVKLADEGIIPSLVIKGGFCPCILGAVPCPCPSLDKAIKDGGTCHCGLFEADGT